MDIVGGQAATDGVDTDGSLLSSNGMTSHHNCCVNRSCRCWRRIKRSCGVVTRGRPLRERSLVLLMLQTHIHNADISVKDHF